MVVDDGVLAMPIVHLTSLASQLVQFNPGLLSCLAMKMTHGLSIRRGKKVCAVIAVILDMEQWNQPSHTHYEICFLRKLGLKTVKRIN
jgi:hypothetical protein